MAPPSEQREADGISAKCRKPVISDGVVRRYGVHYKHEMISLKNSWSNIDSENIIIIVMTTMIIFIVSHCKPVLVFSPWLPVFVYVYDCAWVSVSVHFFVRIALLCVFLEYGAWHINCVKSHEWRWGKHIHTYIHTCTHPISLVKNSSNRNWPQISNVVPAQHHSHNIIQIHADYEQRVTSKSNT